MNNNKLVINCSKDDLENSVVIVIAIPLLFFAVYGKFLSLRIACFITSPMLLGILYVVSNSKRIIMDEKGCVIEFLFLNKIHFFTQKYNWEDILCVKVMDCHKICNDSRYGYPYSNVVVFSHKKVKIPKVIRPDTFSAIRPLSFFYVYFKRDAGQIMHSKRMKSYEIDESLFREKMAEWGVELEEVHY